ncbi:hypothetical protein BASA83_007652 [Batrachochytrium salamandrivorans]|nr:hypothetical protein BASA83_007652 [Batrachochytrium salamandrivorans]
MNIDFVRRGPLSFMERENRVKRGLCLVCGETGHRKVNCPKSRFKFKSDSSRNIRAIQTEENNVPIKLRLADGDSSSMITHRTLTLQLHIGRHVETIGFYVTSLCHGIILEYSWLERHNPQVNWESRMVDFGSNYCLGKLLCLWSTRIQGLGSLQEHRISRRNLASRNQSHPTKLTDSAVDLDIDPSLLKISVWILIWASNNHYFRFPTVLSSRFSLPNNQADSLSVLGSISDSVTPIPPEIDKEFSSVFSESKPYLADTSQL